MERPEPTRRSAPQPFAIDLSVREDVGGCMSLVGNLEDLSLGDLLQIVSMSQKSGVLVLHSSSRSGQIVFRAGLVHAAGIKGQGPDLRGLLADAGLTEADRLEAVLREPMPRGVPTVERLAERAGLPVEQLERPARKAAETAIFEMFGWASGEFSFDGRPEGEGDDPFPILHSGINAQYLAMEGMRLRDEQARAGKPSSEAPTASARDDAPFFGAEPLEVDADDSIELDPSWEEEPATPVPNASVPSSAIDFAVERVLERARERAPTPTGPAATPPNVLASRTAVVIDPDAGALEWIKSVVEGQVARIHVFQRAEEGLARIRQYLIRGEVPVVLIALATPIDPLSGIHGLADFVKRLRAQAARIVILGLNEAGGGRSGGRPGLLDAVLSKPGRERLRTASPAELAPLRAQFVAALSELVARPAEASARADGDAGGGGATVHPQERLAELEAALARAQSQHELGSLLLDAAAGLFTRVALLALRDGEAFPVAGRGIETLEVDPLAASPRLSCPIPPTSLLARVVDSQRPATGALRAQADRLLAAMFGPVEPRHAWLAPIVGPSGVVAVLYGDQGGQRRGMPDVTGLERLVERAGLEHARLALGRARGEVEAQAK